MSYVKRILKWLTEDWEQLLAYNYYVESSDLSDLERRMRQVERGHAPWQKKGGFRARGMM